MSQCRERENRVARNTSSFVEEFSWALSESGLSLKELASAMGRHYTQLHKWSHGTPVPKRETIEVLVGAMGLSSELAEEAEDRLLLSAGHLPRDVEEKLLGSADLVRLVRGMPLSWVQTLLPRLGGVG